jgi:hypothetical protein
VNKITVLTDICLVLTSFGGVDLVKNIKRLVTP